MSKLQTISVVLGIAVAVVGLGLWSSLGWMTPEEHYADIQHIDEHNQAVEQAVTEFRDLWQCDEWAEALDEMLSNPSPSPLDLEWIRRQRAKMDNRGCERFDLE